MADYIRDLRARVGTMPLILSAVGGAIFNDQGDILLQERADTHNWSLPGGFMEFGETFQETLKREMKEDSGYEVEIVAYIGTFEQGFTTYPNGDQTQTISRLYWVTPIGGQALATQTEETLSLRYFDPQHLPPLLNQQAHDMIFAAYDYYQDHH